MSALSYREIYLIMFICSYCSLSTRNTSIYYVSFFHHHKNMLISQIIITKFCLSHKFRINYFCDIFKGHFLLQTLNVLPFQKIGLSRRSKQKNLTQSKHWDTGIYWGSANCVSYYYNRKVLVYNVYSVNNPYIYGGLSIFFPFL